jgi:hypothetical protein
VLEFLVEPEDGDRESCHLHGGGEFADVGHEDVDAAGGEEPCDCTVHDEELLERSGA